MSFNIYHSKRRTIANRMLLSIHSSTEGLCFLVLSASVVSQEGYKVAAVKLCTVSYHNDLGKATKALDANSQNHHAGAVAGWIESTVPLDKRLDVPCALESAHKQDARERLDQTIPSLGT